MFLLSGKCGRELAPEFGSIITIIIIKFNFRTESRFHVYTSSPCSPFKTRDASLVNERTYLLFLEEERRRRVLSSLKAERSPRAMCFHLGPSPGPPGLFTQQTFGAYSCTLFISRSSRRPRIFDRLRQRLTSVSPEVNTLQTATRHPLQATRSIIKLIIRGESRVTVTRPTLTFKEQM